MDAALPVKTPFQHGDPAITAVVGANESGKSQLLTAIDLVLRGQNIEAKDFCRYSEFFLATGLRKPDFGVELVAITPEVRDAFASQTPGLPPAVDRLRL